MHDKPRSWFSWFKASLAIWRGERSRSASMLFAQLPNVGHQLSNLFFRQLAVVRWHLVLALGHDVGELCIRQTLHLRRAQIASAKFLSHRHLAFPICSVAGRTLRLEEAFASTLGQRRAYTEGNQASENHAMHQHSNQIMSHRISLLNSLFNFTRFELNFSSDRSTSLCS